MIHLRFNCRCGKLAKRDIPQDALPSSHRQRDDCSPEKSPLGVTTEMSPSSERESSPVMGAVATKPKAVAQMLTARKMSSFIVSSLSTSKPNEPGSSPTEGKDGEGAVSGDVILSMNDITKEFSLEDDDKIVTLALGHTHSVFATGIGLLALSFVSASFERLFTSLSARSNFAATSLDYLVPSRGSVMCVSVCLLAHSAGKVPNMWCEHLWTTGALSGGRQRTPVCEGYHPRECGQGILWGRLHSGNHKG